MMHFCNLLIGYARVSTEDQDLRLQRGALQEVGCKRTFEETVSGAKRARPELAKMIEQLRDDDTVVVTRLDRLARSTRDLLDIAEKLKEAGAGLRPLAGPWADTRSPVGRVVLTVFAGIAEFERELIHQRTSSGRIAAKARGVRFDRPPKLTPDQIALGKRLVNEGTSVREAAKLLKCHTLSGVICSLAVLSLGMLTADRASKLRDDSRAFCCRKFIVLSRKG